jgi:hypothetical protein
MLSGVTELEYSPLGLVIYEYPKSLELQGGEKNALSTKLQLQVPYLNG